MTQYQPECERTKMGYERSEFSSAFVDFIKNNNKERIKKINKIQRKSTERVHKFREKQRQKRLQDGQLKAHGGSRRGAGRPKRPKKADTSLQDHKRQTKSRQKNKSEHPMMRKNSSKVSNNSMPKRIETIPSVNDTIEIKEEVTEDDDLMGVNKTKIRIRPKTIISNNKASTEPSNNIDYQLSAKDPIQPAVTNATQLSFNRDVQQPIIPIVQLPIIQPPLLIPIGNIQTQMNEPIQLLLNGGFPSPINGPLTMIINTNVQSPANGELQPLTSMGIQVTDNIKNHHVNSTVDEHSAYGEYIANIFRHCHRDEREIQIAREQIGNILLNLKTGAYSKKATSSNFSMPARDREPPTQDIVIIKEDLDF